jgi:hypothetical protein
MKLINRGYTVEENIAESSFTKSLVSKMDYFIKLMEDTLSFADGEKIIVRTDTTTGSKLGLIRIFTKEVQVGTTLWFQS